MAKTVYVRRSRNGRRAHWRRPPRRRAAAAAAATTVTVALGGLALNVSLDGGAAATRPPAVARPMNVKVKARAVDLSFGKVAVHLADRGEMRVDLVSARLRRLHLTLEVANGESVPVKLVGQQQVLVTGDKDRHPAERAAFTITAKGHRRVSLTFVVPSGAVPDSLLLKIAGKSRSVDLTATGTPKASSS
jgi:hypothetical protein